MGAPRRLFTSRQGRDIRGTGSTTDEGVEARRQAGQSSGERGLSRRWSVVRLAPPREEEGRRWNQSRRQSSERREEEAEHEQEQEHMKGHTHPRCLRWEAWRASLRRKDKQSLSCCQAIGRDVRILHHRESLYPLYELHQLGCLEPVVAEIGNRWHVCERGLRLIAAANHMHISSIATVPDNETNMETSTITQQGEAWLLQHIQHTARWNLRFLCQCSACSWKGNRT